MKRKALVRKPTKIFIAKEERVRSLESLLDSYPIELKELGTKDQIIQSFKFEINAALIRLYDKRTETRVKFIEQLRQFFFVGEVYFYPDPKDSRLFGTIIVSRFKDLLDVGMYSAKKYNGHFEKVPDLSWILFNTPFKKVFPSQERIDELERILGYYWGCQDIFIDAYVIEDILEAFTSEKPITSIEFTNKEPLQVKCFIEKLGEFFTISQSYYDHEIFVSHYKNLLDIITYYSEIHEGAFELFADLSGALLLNFERHPPQDIAYYCFNEDLKKYNFIK